MTVDNGALTGPWDLAYEWLILAPGSTYAEGPIKAFCHSLDERQHIIQVVPQSCTKKALVFKFFACFFSVWQDCCALRFLMC